MSPRLGENTICDFDAVVRRSADMSQSLLFLGLEGHLRNPENHLLYLITDSVVEWLMDTERHPEKRIILSEGGIRGPYPSGMTTAEIMRRDSEQGVMAQVAQTYGIELVSAEPPNLLDLHAAAEVVSPTAVIRYAGMRMSRQLFEMGATNDEAAKAISRVLINTGNTLNKRPHSKFAHCDFSYAAFTDDYRRTYTSPFHIKDYKWHVSETVTHMYEEGGSEVQVVSQVANTYRDQNFAHLLTSYYEQGRSPLFVTHIAHVQRIKEQIESLEGRTGSQVLDAYRKLVAGKVLEQMIERDGATEAFAWLERFKRSSKGALAPCHVTD